MEQAKDIIPKTISQIESIAKILAFEYASITEIKNAKVAIKEIYGLSFAEYKSVINLIRAIKGHNVTSASSNTLSLSLLLQSREVKKNRELNILLNPPYRHPIQLTESFVRSYHKLQDECGNCLEKKLITNNWCKEGYRIVLKTEWTLFDIFNSLCNYNDTELKGTKFSPKRDYERTFIYKKYRDTFEKDFYSPNVKKKPESAYMMGLKNDILNKRKLEITKNNDLIQMDEITCEKNYKASQKKRNKIEPQQHKETKIFSVTTKSSVWTVKK